MRNRLPLAISIAALFVAILGWASVGEAAKNLITGKQIKDGSITGIDVKNN